MKLEGPYSEHKWNLSESLVAELSRRVREAAAWCESADDFSDHSALFRSPELRPPTLEEIKAPWTEIALLQAAIEYTVTERSRLLRERGVPIPELDAALVSGHLLGHDISWCTADQLPYHFSEFFDLHDRPGWDCWIHCLALDVDDRKEHNVLCVSFIPDRFVSLADSAMVTSMDCLVWIRPSDIGLRS